MPEVEASNLSANAGNDRVLSDPNSPESIALKAQKAKAQSIEDTRYDAPPPPREAGFTDYVIVYDSETKRSREISAGLFLALATLLFLYKAAPGS